MKRVSCNRKPLRARLYDKRYRTVPVEASVYGVYYPLSLRLDIHTISRVNR